MHLSRTPEELGSDPIHDLVSRLKQLPGIGERTATRLAMFLMGAPKEYLLGLAQTLEDVAERVHLCSVCCSYTLTDPCSICSDPRRDDQTICVVASVQEQTAVERTGVFQGRYHVLHGVLAPLDGIGPEDLRIQELIARMESRTVREVILALSPSVEGDATSLYLANLLKPLGVRVTRIASGIPMGSELEYTDALTLNKALTERRDL